MLPSFYGVIEVKHYHCGHLRIQSEVLRSNENLKDTLIENFKKMDGIKNIQVNPMLGSALILFQEERIEASLLYLILLRMLGIEEEAFRVKPGKLKILIKNVAEAVDMSIYNKTKGFLDVRMVVAAIFLYYGIKKWRINPQLPAGATLLWWAYNMINKGRE